MLSSIITKEIFNLYHCSGTFSFNTKEFQSLFYLIQYNDGKIDLIVEGFAVFYLLEQNSQNEINCSISAKLINESATMKIEEAVIASMNINIGNGKPIYAILNVFKPIVIKSTNDNESNYDNVFVFLTNFLNNVTSNGDFQKFNIENNDYLIEFEGICNFNEYKRLLYEQKEDVLITSIAKIELKNNNVNIIEEIDKLAYLIGYVNRTDIAPVCFNFYKKENLIKRILYPSFTTKFSNREKLIEPKNIKYFIETCHPIFLEKYSDYSLNIVISIYLESLLNNYVDIGYILLITALETFLLSHENLCKQNGKVIKPSSINQKKKILKEFLSKKECNMNDEDIESLAKKMAYENTNLIEKFTLLRNNDKIKSKLNLKEEDYAFPTIRNKIIHTGKFPTKINTSKGEREINMGIEYARTLFLLDKIILSLLEYDGSYNDYLNKKEINF